MGSVLTLDTSWVPPKVALRLLSSSVAQGRENTGKGGQVKDRERSLTKNPYPHCHIQNRFNSRKLLLWNNRKLTQVLKHPLPLSSLSSEKNFTSRFSLSSLHSGAGLWIMVATVNSSHIVSDAPSSSEVGPLTFFSQWSAWSLPRETLLFFLCFS